MSNQLASLRDITTVLPTRATSMPLKSINQSMPQLTRRYF